MNKDFERWCKFPTTKELYEELCRFAVRLVGSASLIPPFTEWLKTDQAQVEYEEWTENWEVDGMERRIEYRRESDRVQFEAWLQQETAS